MNSFFARNRPGAMTRRAATQSLAATAVGLAFPETRSETRPADNFIDAHVHVWTTNTTHWPLATGYQASDMDPASFTPKELMRHAAAAGVQRVVLIQMSYYGYDNSYMLHIIDRDPQIYRGVAIVDQSRSPTRRMKRLATRGVRGFRIQPHDKTPADWLTSDGMKQMWSTAADERLAMCHLINPEFLPSVNDMCQKYPKTPVVIDHFARIGIDGQIRKSDVDNLCRLADRPEVSVKVSAYYALGKKKMPYDDLGDMIARLRDCFGADRLMWASDCPFQVQGDHTYAASIDLIRDRLPFLSTDERNLILRGTAERVFFET
jgi:predicted TIM-barrel fold metal-dependent hydrolase